MPAQGESSTTQQRLQMLDVNVVDVLAQLEALLRHSHSIQRGLLQLRSEAPPPASGGATRVVSELNDHAGAMKRESDMLREIINDLSAGIQHLSRNR